MQARYLLSVTQHWQRFARSAAHYRTWFSSVLTSSSRNGASSKPCSRYGQQPPQKVFSRTQVGHESPLPPSAAQAAELRDLFVPSAFRVPVTAQHPVRCLLSAARCRSPAQPVCSDGTADALRTERLTWGEPARPPLASPPGPAARAWQRSGAFRGNSWPLPPASPSSPGTVRTALPGRTGGKEGEGRPRAQGWTEKGAQRRQLPPAALRGRQHPSGDQNNAGTAGLPAPLPARGASSHPRTPPQPPPAAGGRGDPAYLSRPSPVPAAVTLVHPPRLRDSRGAAQPCPAQRRTRRPAPRWLRTAPASCRPRAGAAHPGPASCCRGGRGAREDDGACGLKRAGYRTSAQPFLHMQGPACPPCLRRSPPCHLCCRWGGFHPYLSVPRPSVSFPLCGLSFSVWMLEFSRAANTLFFFFFGFTQVSTSSRCQKQIWARSQLVKMLCTSSCFWEG